MLEIRLEKGSPLAEEAAACRERCRGLEAGIGGGAQLLLSFGSRVELHFSGPPELAAEFPRPFFLDFARPQLLRRLSRCSRAAEPLCRAVLGKLKAPLVYDATAGLGRDALLLQAAGARVRMFERSVVIWELLHDALRRAAASPALQALLPQGLPGLMPCGTLAGQHLQELPEVIYFDPMFPQRHKSALVKKELRMLHYIVGADQDAEEYLQMLLRLALVKVVVKRPAGAGKLGGAQALVSGSTGGKICRYDIYPALAAEAAAAAVAAGAAAAS